MKNLFLLFFACFSFIGLSGQVTFSKDIAPIIYEHCTNCHRPGEIGPMPFTSYGKVKNWGNMIEYVTSIRYMPPWKADPEFSTFLGENVLTDTEIQLISEWVAAGMPQGDPSEEPPLPEFPEGSQLGEPDLVLSFSESYTHYGGNEDEYRIFVLPTGLTEDKDLAAIELRPGNTQIVHHALFTYDTTETAAANDAESPEYGYEGFGGFGIPGTFNRQFPGYVPGQKARVYPEGIGQRIPANSDLLIQIHYAPVPFEETDSSTVNLFFKDEPVSRYVESHVMLPFFGTLQNGPFLIPPNTVKTFHGIWEVEEDLSLLGLVPHMHLLGQNWTVIAVHPDGDTTNLISIPEWDFNWQGSYSFKQFIPVDAGSVIHAFATYDNTSSNPLNPNDPPKWVSWGEKTTDEMYYLPILYVPYQPGDEDIVFEEENPTQTKEVQLHYPDNRLFPVYPNPAQTEIQVGFSLATGTKVSLEICDLKGQVLEIICQSCYYPIGNHQIRWDLNDLETGLYLVRLRSDSFQLNEKVVVVK